LCPTGAAVDIVSENNEKTAQELCGLLEAYGLVAALVASVMYPSLQHAADVSALVDERADGLGAAYLVCSVVSAFGFAVCAMLSPLFSVMTRCCPSEECANHWRACGRLELRAPQVLFLFGMPATLATVCLETVVRLRGLAAGGSDAAGWASAEETAYDSRAFVLASVTMITISVYAVVVGLMLAAKAFRSVRIFSAETSPAARLDRESLALAARGTPWFASPSSQSIRKVLDAYWQEFEGGPFANPAPAHWRLYLRQEMHKLGHGDLSHLTCRMADLLFEERIQTLLEASNVKVEHAQQLVASDTPRVSC